MPSSWGATSSSAGNTAFGADLDRLDRHVRQRVRLALSRGVVTGVATGAAFAALTLVRRRWALELADAGSGAARDPPAERTDPAALPRGGRALRVEPVPARPRWLPRPRAPLPPARRVRGRAALEDCAPTTSPFAIPVRSRRLARCLVRIGARRGGRPRRRERVGQDHPGQAPGRPLRPRQGVDLVGRRRHRRASTATSCGARSR